MLSALDTVRSVRQNGLHVSVDVGVLQQAFETSGSNFNYKAFQLPTAVMGLRGGVATTARVAWADPGPYRWLFPEDRSAARGLPLPR